jgi:hypothetical protein
MAIDKSILDKLSGLSMEEQKEVVEYIESVCRKRDARKRCQDRELSAAEHARVVDALDEVAALSIETGPPASNRDHDRHL